MKQIRLNSADELLRHFGMQIQGNIVVQSDEETVAIKDLSDEKSDLPDSDKGE